jgi:hypothetical protein
MNSNRELYLYDGQVLKGYVVIDCDTAEASAFDSNGKHFGRFSGFKGAAAAIERAYKRTVSQQEEVRLPFVSGLPDHFLRRDR